MDANRQDALINLLKESDMAYYCKFCGRHLPLKDGVYIHDEVPHPENYVYEGGHHVH